MILNPHGNRFSTVAADMAVDRDHPLNRGRAVWYMPGLPGTPAAGGRLLNLCSSSRGHGTFTAMPAATTGWRSPSRRGSYGCLLFDGTAAYVSVPYTPISGATSFTAAVWVNEDPNDASYGSWINGNTASGAAITFAENAGNGFDVQSWVGGVKISSSTLIGAVTGAWHRYVLVYAASVQTVYRDTVSVATGAAGASVGAHTGLQLGGAAADGFYTKSQLDDITIWTRALSTTEIAADYQLSLRGYAVPDGPLRWLSTRSYSVPGVADGGPSSTDYLVSGSVRRSPNTVLPISA